MSEERDALNWNFITEWFVPLHNEDIPEAKYRIGQAVLHNDQIRTVTGVNYQEPGYIEYSLEGHPFLVYEYLLSEVI